MFRRFASSSVSRRPSQLSSSLRYRSFNTTASTFSCHHPSPFNSTRPLHQSEIMPAAVYASTAPEATIADSTIPKGDLKSQQANVLKLEQISRDFRT